MQLAGRELVLLAAREEVVKLKLTAETRLKDLLGIYPWLKEELGNIHPRFRLLSTPLGKLMLGKADIAEMSRRSGLPLEELITKLETTIERHLSEQTKHQ